MHRILPSIFLAACITSSPTSDNVDGDTYLTDAASDAGFLDSSVVETCDPPLQHVKTDGFDLREPLGDGPFYFHRRGLDGALWIHRTDHPEQPLFSGTLVAAGGGAILFQDNEGLKWTHGPEVQLLTPTPDVRYGTETTVYGSRALWFESNGRLHSTEWDGPLNPEAGARSPRISAEVIAWIESNGEQARVKILRPDGPHTVFETLFIQTLAVGTSDVYFIAVEEPMSDTHVYRYNLVTDNLERLADRCDQIFAGGDRAAFVCQEEDGWSSLKLYDGELYEIASRATFGGAAINDTHLAWAEYEEIDAWCTGMALGQVRVTRGRGQPIHTLANIESGCMCCGAIWPDLVLSLGQGLAWNYAEGSPADVTINAVDCLP